MSEVHETSEGGSEEAVAARGPSDAPPETGDLVVDAALRDFAAVDDTDLDATVAAGEAVHQTLTSRLEDLGT